MRFLVFYIQWISVRPISEEERPFHIATALLMTVPVFIGVVWFVIVNARYTSKKSLVKKFIKEFSKTDPFWNHDKMIELADSIFRSIQIAWYKNDFKAIKDSLTNHMKTDFINTWESLKSQNYRFICTSILVERVTIIGAEDHDGRDNDSFTVEISGRIIRYLLNNSTGKLVDDNTNSIQEFTDIYYFKRLENRWLLDKIRYDADITDTLGHKVIDNKD